MDRPEAKKLSVGDKVTWIATPEPVHGEVTETNWMSVKVKWDDGVIGIYHHADMGEFERKVEVK